MSLYCHPTDWYLYACECAEGWNGHRDICAECLESDIRDFICEFLIKVRLPIKKYMLIVDFIRNMNFTGRLFRVESCNSRTKYELILDLRSLGYDNRVRKTACFR